MTVVLSGNTLTFVGDGVQDLFDFNFRIFKAEDLCAVVRNSLGNEKRLVSGSDFKIVSGLGDEAGGRMQYPVSGEPLASGENLTLYREIPYTQELELVDNDPFSAQLLNEAFDRGVMRDQQLQEQLDRALKYEISTPGEERLSPQEMVQTITSACDDAVSARSGAIEAEGIARDLFDEAQAARLGSESARDKAEDARDAAEQARDTAIKISIGDISALRSPAPVLAGPVEAPEGMTVSIVISDYLEDELTSYEVDTDGFGTASIFGDVIKWTLDTVDGDVSKILKVVRRRRGELYSDTANHQLFVKKVEVQDGPTMVFADSVEGYPGAIVDADGVHSPAHSVGADNAKQVTSAKPEIIQTSGKLTVKPTTTEAKLDVEEQVNPGDIYTNVGTVSVTAEDITPLATQITPTLADFTGATDAFEFEGSKLICRGTNKAMLGKPISGDFTFAWRAQSTMGSNSIAVGLHTEATVSRFTENVFDGGTDHKIPDTATFFDLNPVTLSTGAGAYSGFFGATQLASPDPSGQICKYERVGDKLSLYVGATKVAEHTGTEVLYPVIGMYYVDADWIEDVSMTMMGSSIDISAAGFTEPPVSAIKVDAVLKIGAGATGEHLGPKIDLDMGTGSTRTQAIVNSFSSVKNKIILSSGDGSHDNIEINGNLVKPTSVSEVVITIPGSTADLIDGTQVYSADLVSGTYSASKAADGDILTSWASQDVTQDHWWKVDFGDGVSKRVGRVEVDWGRGETTTDNILIQGSNDDVDWSTVYEKGSGHANPATDVYNIAAFKGYRYYRIYIVYSSGSQLQEIFEVRMYEVDVTIYTTTINIPEQPEVATSVAIPDRCTLSPANYTITPDGDDIKITGEEIVLEDNPDIKRLAMSVSGPEGMTFKGGRIYIKEKP